MSDTTKAQLERAVELFWEGRTPCYYKKCALQDRCPVGKVGNCEDYWEFCEETLEKYIEDGSIPKRKPKTKR